MLKRLWLLIVPALFLALPSVVFAATNFYPTGPKTVNVGQTFTVVMTMSGAKDVDTIRADGSYTQDLLQWKGAAPTGVFQDVSPGTYVDQNTGVFSFGAFTLSSHANNTAPTAVLTFKALKAGTAYVQLTTGSRVLSDGVDQLGTIGRLTIVIKQATPVPEQPQPIPTVVPTGTAAISLVSLNEPNPDVWYATSTVHASWQVAGKAVKTMYIGFDQSPEGPADTVIDTTSTSFNVPTDGVWYVHLNVVFSDGSRQRADLRVQIDRQPPHAEVPVTDQTNVPASIPNAVRFGTLDDTSGIDHYDLFIDGTLVTSTILQAYPLQGLAPGTHQINVNAYDRAGNVSSGQTQVVILPPVVPAGASSNVQLGFSLAWLWIILLLLFILISWFLIDRRRRREQEQPKKRRQK
ncbi:MAG: cohesin domain-containing protein [Patescibacteria group bacterium]